MPPPNYVVKQFFQLSFFYWAILQNVSSAVATNFDGQFLFTQTPLAVSLMFWFPEFISGLDVHVTFIHWPMYMCWG